MGIASIKPLIIWYNIKDIPKTSNIRGEMLINSSISLKVSYLWSKFHLSIAKYNISAKKGNHESY